METKLWEAIELLDNFGWIKHGDIDRQGRMCMLFALGSVHLHYEMNEGFKRDIAMFCEVAREQFPQRDFPIGHIVGFNDHTDTTYADIKLVAEKAAARIEEMA